MKERRARSPRFFSLKKKGNKKKTKTPNMGDDERVPILAEPADAASHPPAAFTDVASPPRPARFDGVSPPPGKIAVPLASPTARRAALAAAAVVLLLAGVGVWTLVGGRGVHGTPVRAGVDTVSVPAGARKVGAGVLLW